MGKLGKKARKFAKKHLQGVLKHRRKMKVIMKRKSTTRDRADLAEDQAAEVEVSNKRNPEFDDIGYNSLDAIFSEDDSNVKEDSSDSDGYLSEDSSCSPSADSECETYLEENTSCSALSEKSRKIQLDLAREKEKLDRLKKKDPKFTKFLEKHVKELESRWNEETETDEGESSEHDAQSCKDGSRSNSVKVLTCSCIKSWVELVTEKHDVSALVKLLNGYRAACNYGTRSDFLLHEVACRRIESSEAFCTILTCVLREADTMFRVLLEIPGNNCRNDTIMGLKKSAKWETTKPLIKSYLRSTLVLLNQVTDSDILTFALTGLRASVVFFGAFPSLLHKLIKVCVHLWSTCRETVSLCSFFIILDVAKSFSYEISGTCLMKTYRAYIANCDITEPGLIKHLQFLRNSLVELCSVDVQKSSSTALVSIKLLARILRQGMQLKMKEALKTICSWQYVNCIDLWVTYISMNIRDYDLQELLRMVIQIINGVTNLFPGSRYLPLRFKCIQWLNTLSSSSGLFIPVASLVLDTLEHNSGKEVGSFRKASIIPLNLNLPKHWLKSPNYQEYCVCTAIEVLSVHFFQWSYHISFPDLATIPLICLRRFCDRTASESLRRVVKRFIDQVDQNVGYVQRKRDDVAFSPKDQQRVESFLQEEKFSGKASFTLYYRSVIEKAAARNLVFIGNKSVEHKESGGQSDEKVKRISKKRMVNFSADDAAHIKGKRVKKVKKSGVDDC